MAILKLVEKDGKRIEISEADQTASRKGSADANPDASLPAVGWRVREYIGTDPATGRRKIVTRTFTRQKDAEKEERRLRDLKETGTFKAPSKEPVGKYLRHWLESVKRGQLRARTFSDYSGVLRRYIEDAPPGAPPIGSVRVDQLSPEGIQQLYAFLQFEEGLSPRTIRSLHAVIRQGLAHAVKTGAAPRNAAELVELPKQEKREVKAMSADEVARFLQAAREDRYYPLWCVLVSGGLRPGEALALKWADVDSDRAKVHVRRALTRRGVKGWKLVPPKRDGSRRVVVLPSFAMAALREWRARQAAERLQLGSEYEDSGFVFATEFGKPLDGANLYARNFTRIMEAAGIGEREEPEPRPEGRPGPRKQPRFKPKYRLYDLRHTCATTLFRHGVNPKVVSERLGHASVAFTMDVYASALPDMQEEAADKLEAMLGGA